MDYSLADLADPNDATWDSAAGRLAEDPGAHLDNYDPDDFLDMRLTAPDPVSKDDLLFDKPNSLCR